MLRCMLSLRAATGISRSEARTVGFACAAEGSLRSALYVLMGFARAWISGSAKFRDCTRDARAAFVENLDRGRDRQPEVRRQAIGRACHQRDADALEQVHHDVAVLGKPLARWRRLADQAGAIDVEIEGPVGLAAAQ